MCLEKLPSHDQKANASKEGSGRMRRQVEVVCYKAQDFPSGEQCLETCELKVILRFIITVFPKPNIRNFTLST